MIAQRVGVAAMRRSKPSPAILVPNTTLGELGPRAQSTGSIAVVNGPTYS